VLWSLETAMPTLKDERDAFERLLPSLLEQHRGEYVIVADGEPLGFHHTFAGAYGAAVKALGAAARFLVAEVKPLEPQPISLAWSTFG